MRAWKYVLVAALVAIAIPVLATFHLTKIVEVYGGSPASPNAQYFITQAYASGQNLMGGHTYQIYNASGTLTEQGTIPSNVANSANQMRVLFATTQAQSFFNVTADVTIPAEIIQAGGKVCFETTIDCVAWGSWSGGTTGVGTPFNVSGGGLPPGRAAKRRLDISGGATTLESADDTGNSATDFVEGLPAPRNNANVIGTIPPSTCGNNILEGVEQCDDHNTNNGDGCSSTCALEAGGATPSLTIADVSTTEGNSGTKLLTFTVNLSAAAAGAVTYDIATSNGTATAGSDYVANSLVGESIPAGQTSKTFAVTINGDATVEPDENFNVTVSNVAGATVGDGAAVGTITNDDGGGGGPTLTIADVSTTEGNAGTKLLKFTVTLSAAASGTVSYDIATSNGTATAGSDYVAKSLTGQNILAGNTSKIFNVTINGDATVEPDENFNVTVSNVVGATVGDGAAVGTITNDDSGGGTPSLTIADVSTTEGNSGTKLLTFTVNLSAAAAGAVTYDIATSNGTATAGSDYVANSLVGESIAAGVTSKSFAVTINGDATVEPDENFNVTVSNVVGATVGDGAAVGTITNDDGGGGGGPTLTIADVSTTEGNAGTKLLKFTVTLSAAASGTVSYDIATSNGTATAGSDYVAKSLTGQNILAGGTSKVFNVTINGDATVEPDENFNVTVSNVVGATVGDGAAVGTITNDDAGGGTPSLTIADVSTTEGNSGTKLLTFTVNLSAAAAGAVTYDIATSNGTATAGSDYVANSLVGESIAAGVTSKSFAVTINGDATVEPDENFNVTVSNVVGATVGDGAAVGTITNDDGGGGGPTLTIADVSTTEGNAGTKLLKFTVTLSAAAAGSVTYDIATSNGTATAGSDYVAKSLTGQNILAGNTSKIFNVTINGDATVEPDENFNVTVSNVVGATVGDGAAVGTITNDDAGGGTPSLTIADVSTTEGNSGTKLLTFTVNLSAAAAGAVTYDIATSNGTATAGSDYVANSLVGESIAAGVTSKSFAVTINGDATVEPDENFNVTVSNVVGATVGDGAAVGTITNDDGGGGGPTLTIADVSTSEGNSGTKTLTFTVSLSASAAGAVTYDIATSNGTATAGSDYVANSLVGQSIAAGMTSKTFGVTINGDTSVESDETFNVTVSNVVGATVGDGAAVGTITNDDSGGGGPTLSIADASAVEGSGGGYGRNMSFTVSLSAPASGTVSFNFDTSDGTAFAGEDYEQKNLVGQTILAGATSKVIRVGLYGDVDPEPDETFNATLSNVSGATLGDGTAVGTIANDDGTLALKLASLRMPKEAAAAPSEEALRVLQAVNLLCSELGAPALVALRGNGLPPLARELAAESKLQPDCARAANFVVATARSARDGADAPALLLDSSAVREGVARAEMLESTRLFESTREGSSGRYLFDSAPLLVRVRLNDAHGGPVEMAILVLGRESQASTARREAQAAALSSWLWSMRDHEPNLAVAIAGPLAASELRGFPLGEIATPRSATRGEHLLGNAPLLDAARSLGHGESCALPRTDGMACALSELEFVP